MNYHAKRGEPHLTKTEKGVATIEFALTAILFFTVFFAIIDFAYLFWGNLSMQHAVREGARYAVTGQAGLAPPTSTNPKCDAAVQALKNQSMGFYDRVSPVITFKKVDANGTIIILGTSCDSVDIAPNQIIVISVASTLPLLTPLLKPFFTDGSYAFTVSATMRTEAF